MEEKVNFAVVGIFVLVLGAALIGGVLWFSSGKSYNKVYDIYQTYMSESVSGLNLNAPVRYRGVEVGRVQRIRLAPDNVEQVQLTLGIVHGTPIKADTVALLQTQGLTGLTFVELNGGSHNAPPLTAKSTENYPVIQSGPSLITRLDTSVTAMLSNINRTSQNINSLLDEDNLKSIKNTLRDIETLSNILASRRTEIDSSLKDMARFSSELPQLAQRIRHSTESFDHMTNELAKASSSTRATMDSTRQFTNETLPAAQQLIVELRDLTHSLQRVSDELEQNPSALLYGKTLGKRGPGE